MIVEAIVIQVLDTLTVENIVILLLEKMTMEIF